MQLGLYYFAGLKLDQNSLRVTTRARKTFLPYVMGVIRNQRPKAHRLMLLSNKIFKIWASDSVGMLQLQKCHFQSQTFS